MEIMLNKTVNTQAIFFKAGAEQGNHNFLQLL